MARINTTGGAVDDSDLGLTLIHEHMWVRSEAVSFQFPHLYDEEREYERAITQVSAAMERGVKTICDPTVMEAGRDIRFMSRIAEETGIQLVASTGIYAYHYVAPHSRTATRTTWRTSSSAGRGYADRMMLSQDACCTIDWFPEELVAQMAPNWHMSYVLDEIVPALKEAGVTDEQVDQMMVEAPRRWLAAGG